MLDPDGKPIAGAAVVVRNTRTGYNRALVTDGTGHFNAAAMPVGSYTVDGQAPGFATVHEEGLVLKVGQTETVTLRMSLAPVTEQVTVTAEATRLDASNAAAGTSINLKAIADLPIRGRNFTEFAQLTPAIVQESDRSGLVIFGQRSINSNVSIDGIDFNDSLQGNQRGGNEAVFFFPQAGVQEFQVVRSGAGAEIGRTSAGFVNVVTKSGTNTPHGEAFYFNRNKSLTSADAFDQKLNNQQNQFGGSIGGALVPDKTFLFLAGEQNFLRVPFVVKFQDQAAAVVVPAAFKALEGEQHGTNNPTALFGRLDMHVTPGQTLNLQYTYSRLRGENFNFDSPQQDTAASANYTRKNRSNGIKAGLVSVLSSRIVNEARLQAATDNRDEQPNVLTPQIVITGFGTIGGDRDRPRVFNSTRYEATDNLSIVTGLHQVRVGFDFNANQQEQRRESNILGRYDYKSLADYVAGKINRYRQTVPGFDPNDLLYRGTQRELGVFAQDQMTLGRDVTLTAGLRWDGQWNPQPTRPNPAISYTAAIPNDLNMWQPRLGLAWNANGAGRTVVHLSAGLYDARTPGNLFQRVFTDNGITTVAVDSKTDPSVIALVQNGSGLTSAPAGLTVAAPRIFGFDPSFSNPRSVQLAGSIDQQLAQGLVLAVGYIHQATSNLQRRLDRNLFPPTIDATGMPIYPTVRPNPAIGVLSINESTANARYNALTLTATHRTSHTQLQVNYTLAGNKDDDSNERNFSREVTLNVFDPEAEYTWSKQDVRHSVNASGVLNLPGSWTLGAILMARLGMPYTAVIGFDTQNDGNDDNDRAIISDRVSDRNAFRQPSFFNLDLRLVKQLSFSGRRLDLVAEVFNATRASNKHYGNDSISAFGTAA
ncbi:MAG: TonB-dependent receptor, partial [Acidobacteria bacterium]|nr:TonB-dependent receptor [Acidobacteriota bacterium]